MNSSAERSCLFSAMHILAPRLNAERRGSGARNPIGIRMGPITRDRALGFHIPRIASSALVPDCVGQALERILRFTTPYSLFRQLFLMGDGSTERSNPN
jgi:hypothetical protein